MYFFRVIPPIKLSNVYIYVRIYVNECYSLCLHWNNVFLDTIFFIFIFARIANCNSFLVTVTAFFFYPRKLQTVASHEKIITRFSFRCMFLYNFFSFDDEILFLLHFFCSLFLHFTAVIQVKKILLKRLKYIYWNSLYRKWSSRNVNETVFHSFIDAASNNKHGKL